MDILAKKIIAYMEAKKYVIDRRKDCVNIVYIEGANGDGSANKDEPDGWNDRRIVILFDDQEPFCVLNVEATTEPGISATISKSAQSRGGVARIPFGQFRVWRRGFHKRDLTHPALVQVGQLWVHRDLNRDFKRTGDKLLPASGINQHGTRDNTKVKFVGMWSEGCLVGWSWFLHKLFIKYIDGDPRYISDNNYLFYTTIIDGDDFAMFTV